MRLNRRLWVVCGSYLMCAGIAAAAPAPVLNEAVHVDPDPAAAPQPAPQTAPQPAPQTAPQAAPNQSLSEEVVINAAGDISYANGWAGEDECEAKGVKLFEEVQPLLDEGDLNFVNLEAPFTDHAPAATKRFVIVSKPHRLNWVADAGFNLLSLANNHSVDAGEEGLFDTIKNIEALSTADRPLFWSGAGHTPEEAKQTHYFTVPGKHTKVGFLAMGNNGSSLVDSTFSASAVDRIKAAAAKADLVIVSSHNGDEYHHVPKHEMVARYHEFIDAGAKIVFGHHPHVIQGIERYHGGVIFYSLGNFSFNSKTKRNHETGAKMYSMLARVVVRDNKVAEVAAYPLYVNNSEPLIVDGQRLGPKHATPQLLHGAFANQVMSELIGWSKELPKADPTTIAEEDEHLVVGDFKTRKLAARRTGGRVSANTGTNQAPVSH